MTKKPPDQPGQPAPFPDEIYREGMIRGRKMLQDILALIECGRAQAAADKIRDVLAITDELDE